VRPNARPLGPFQHLDAVHVVEIENVAVGWRKDAIVYIAMLLSGPPTRRRTTPDEPRQAAGLLLHDKAGHCHGKGLCAGSVNVLRASALNAEIAIGTSVPPSRLVAVTITSSIACAHDCSGATAPNIRKAAWIVPVFELLIDDPP
jgi:hypothetical protein